MLHVIPSLSPSSGGPSVALPAMARALAARGVHVSVVTTDDDGPGRRLSGIPLVEEVTQEGGWSVRYFPKQTEFYKVSLPLRRWLRKHVHEYDVVHVHAVFSFASLAAGRAAAARGVPFIVRPLGVLNRWGMANRRRLVKSMSFGLLELPMLRRAAAMHYTSQMELQEAARFHLRNRQVILPIGIDLAPFASLPPATIFTDQFPASAGRRNVLFLSRIDVKKGVDLLLPAFARVHPAHPETHLIVCGGGAPDLVTKLQAQAQSLGLAGHITWAGEVTGQTRLAAFAAAELFVLPSHSENFGIALLEAMAAGLACVSSDQVALAVDAAPAVRVVPLDVEVIAKAMDSLLSGTAERQALAASGRELAFKHYSLEAMGAGLNQLYQEVAVRAA
ncbi:MAG TPA: glycosyltransferase [Prosthecobacter sp.]